MTEPIILPIDENKLYELYIDKHLRLFDIAEMFKCSSWRIKKELKKYNIPIRKRGYGFLVHNEIELTNEQFEFFDGLMASDGSIVRRKDSPNKRAGTNDFVSCAFKYKEFAEYIVNKLDLQTSVKYKVHHSNRYKTGECGQYYFYSKNNIFFNKQRDRWYPGGKKIIPNDIRITPVSMNIWYLSDGYLYKSKNSSSRRIYLCTQSFSKENLENTIIKKLYEIGIGCTIKSDNQINFNSENTVKFLNYIGECPIECYKYKWDIGELVNKKFLIIPKKEQLIDLYTDKKFSTTEIGKIFNCSYNYINRCLRKYEIPVRLTNSNIYR